MSDAGNPADIEMPVPRSPFNSIGYALLWLLVIALVSRGPASDTMESV
jgi:hypothetical protein